MSEGLCTVLHEFRGKTEKYMNQYIYMIDKYMILIKNIEPLIEDSSKTEISEFQAAIRADIGLLNTRI